MTVPTPFLRKYSACFSKELYSGHKTLISLWFGIKISIFFNRASGKFVTAVRESFVSCKEANISIEAVKPAEDGQGVIIRGCEVVNRRGMAQLSFLWPIINAWECDMMENKEEILEVNGTNVVCEFSPLEIKTIRIEFV